MANETPADAPLPQQVLQMITGLWVSQVTGLLAKLSIADHLVAGPKTAVELAKACEANAPALARVLRAAASVGLLAQSKDRFSLTPLGELLRSDVPGSMRGMAIAQTSPGHWQPWGRLLETVRTGQRQTVQALGSELWDYYEKQPQEAQAFTTAMKDMSAMVGDELVWLIPLESAATLVDVGGASGSLALAMLRAHPQLKGVVLDLPHVRADAEKAFHDAGVSDRCQFATGDFFKEVPKGDLTLLKFILHDWNDEQCISILRACARSLSPKGRIVVVEMIIPEDGRQSIAPLLDINMLVLLPGRERTRSEYESLFKSAGLRLHQILETHSPFQILDARPA